VANGVHGRTKDLLVYARGGSIWSSLSPLIRV
jgi:hypothetical protein